MDIIVGDRAYSLTNASISKTKTGLRINIPTEKLPVKLPFTDPDAAYDAVCQGFGKTTPVNLTEFLPKPDPEPVDEAAETEDETEDATE